MTTDIERAIQQLAKAGALSLEDATRLAEHAVRDFELVGIDAQDMDDALIGALALAIQPVPRKRRVWPYVTGFCLAAVCFVFAAWNLFFIAAPAVW